MINRKKTAKETLSNPPPQVDTSKRIEKVLDDYVDASFSESKPPLCITFHYHRIKMHQNGTIKPIREGRQSLQRSLIEIISIRKCISVLVKYIFYK